MSVNEKMTAIADNLREFGRGSIAGKLGLDDMANSVKTVFLEGYNEGYSEGEAQHTVRYATAFVKGDGTNVILFRADFKPDCFFVTPHGASAIGATAIQQMIFDARSFARYGGMYRIRKDGTNTQGTMASASGGNYFKWADGMCTVECPSALGVNYIADAQYICTVVKYTNKTDRELLEEEIAMLSNEARTIEYSKTRINATVTDAEWQTMIAPLTNITFSLR